MYHVMSSLLRSRVASYSFLALPFPTLRYQYQHFCSISGIFTYRPVGTLGPIPHISSISPPATGRHFNFPSVWDFAVSAGVLPRSHSSDGSACTVDSPAGHPTALAPTHAYARSALAPASVASSYPPSHAPFAASRSSRSARISAALFWIISR